MREIARRPAEAAADVEEVQTGAELDLSREIGRRLPSPDVELVDRRQIGRREPVEILARGSQRLEVAGSSEPYV